MIDQNILQNNGYYFPISILDQHEINKIKKKILKLHKKSELVKYQPHLFYSWMYNLCYNTRLISLFKQIVGDNPIVWNTAIFIKTPNQDIDMAPHQDTAYDGVISDLKYTVYLAITENNQSSGSLYFYKKSHTLGKLNHVHCDINNMHGSKLKVNFELSNFEKKFVTLSSGQASVHHMNTVHGSYKNFKNDYRISIGFRLTNNLARFTGKSIHGIVYNKGTENLKNYEFIENKIERLKLANEDLEIFYKNFVNLKNIT